MNNLDELVTDIKDFMGSLNQPLLSEIQLEVLLALYLKETGKYDEVYAEYTFPTSLLGKEYCEKWGRKNDKVSVDLVVRKGKEYIPIELKYKTRYEELEYTNIFGTDQIFKLAKQSAENENCYGFWKDVKRIELIKEKFDYVKCGAVLFVTNAEIYKNGPEKGSQYAPFSIDEGKIVEKETSLKWDETKTNITQEKERKFPPFMISNNYEIKWAAHSIGEHNLYYLILPIVNNKP